MPCGLYIWLAVSPSLYPPVWLITWRRVSTWNIEKQQTKQGQSQQETHEKKREGRGGDKTTREATRVHCCKYILGDNKNQSNKKQI